MLPNFQVDFRRRESTPATSDNTSTRDNNTTAKRGNGDNNTTAKRGNGDNNATAKRRNGDNTTTAKRENGDNTTTAKREIGDISTTAKRENGGSNTTANRENGDNTTTVNRENGHFKITIGLLIQQLWGQVITSLYFCYKYITCIFFIKKKKKNLKVLHYEYLELCFDVNWSYLFYILG